MTVSQEFDFIVVGGGTSGCLLASRLANTASAPKVALLEAGPAINKPEYRRTFERFSTVFEHASLDYGYMSTPQAACNGRQIPQNRGKGLGGSSAVNFQVWALGAKSEFETWKNRVGDESWGFDQIIERVKMLENLHTDGLEAEWGEYIKPDSKAHGNSGPIDVSLGYVEGEVKAFIDAGVELGYQRNLDPNDGNLVGFSLAPTTSCKGVRTTAASAFIENNVPDNLTILDNTRIVKIIFDGKRAVGVLKDDGTKLTAKKEVILSAGSLDSPRLLMLSGVGPQADLRAHGIEVVKDLDGVGKEFADHPTVVCAFHMGPGFTRRMHTTEHYQEALEEMNKYGTGPLLEHFSSSPQAFLKAENMYDSEEFQNLEKDVQEMMRQPDTPNYEIIVGPLIPPTYKFEKRDDGFCTLFIATMNSQARGDIKLASSNPEDPPLVNPNYLDHPFDVIAMKEGMKTAMKIMGTPTMKKHYIKPILTPKSDSDEDVMEFIKNNVSGLWHPSCSVHMGRSEQDGSCVDGDLKVHGLEGLRVADLSVTPLLPSGHPQIVAYVIGQIAAEKVAKEHGL